jgi:Zn-dependent protease
MPSMLELVQSLAVWALPVLFAFCGHAIVMAQVAWRMGDRSEAMRERLSLNPLKHADPVGTFLVPGLLIAFKAPLIFGWPKAVPLEPRAFANPRKDIALVFLAALVSNLAMALAWAVLYKVALLNNTGEGLWAGITQMAEAGVVINVIFLLFGLLPIPGFACGYVVGAILPRDLAERWYASQNLVFIALLVLMATGFLGLVISGPFRWLLGAVLGVVGIGS